MQITLELFGRFRDFHPASTLALDCADATSVDDVRVALVAYGEAHWPGFDAGLVLRSALASREDFLPRGAAIPADGRLAIIPPVSGG